MKLYENASKIRYEIYKNCIQPSDSDTLIYKINHEAFLIKHNAIRCICNNICNYSGDEKMIEEQLNEINEYFLLLAIHYEFEPNSKIASQILLRINANPPKNYVHNI